MMDRRTVLKFGAALSAATLLPQLQASAFSATGSVAIERFVFDDRFAEAISAGRNVGATGIPISGVNGDLTALWYNDLSVRWKDKPMALAGLTAQDALFVLGTLAPAYRMRVLDETEWGIARTIGPDSIGTLPLYSWVIAPAGLR
ncbi:twin-arginine translocation signal domain-containing protein [Candidatus Rariloculus sp.]|uniref:twin-arginine translocation signal domain-containing protein n=1 Tax=Candidatus Rariloculus sp. TaxID=3101265 RepID=UPI003D12AC9E